MSLGALHNYNQHSIKKKLKYIVADKRILCSFLENIFKIHVPSIGTYII